MVYTPVLGAGAERRGGSSPLIRTKEKRPRGGSLFFDASARSRAATPGAEVRIASGNSQGDFPEQAVLAVAKSRARRMWASPLTGKR